MSSAYHYQNGKFVEKDKCFLHITDLSIQRSYAVFDYLIFINKVPLYLEDYISRFRNSVKLMGLEFQMSNEEVTKVVLELIERNDISKGGIKFIFTGGYAANGYDADEPNFIIMHLGFPKVADLHYENGIKLLLEEYNRDFPEAKTTDYFFSLSLKDRIKAENAFDVLYHDNGKISESSRSNFFIVDQNDVVCTTSKGILMGVTRKNLIKAAKGHFKVEERPIYTSELNNIKEAFLTSSVKRIIPITTIGEYTIGDGRPGNVTEMLMKLLKKRDDGYINNFVHINN